MLQKLFKYSGIFAKIKSMQSTLLRDDDYKQLVAKNSVIEVADFLKNNTGYKKVLANISEMDMHRGRIENILLNYMQGEINKIMHFGNGGNKVFLYAYITKYEIELIKQMLRMLESGSLSNFHPVVDSYYKKHMSIDVEKLMLSESIPQFIENLKDSAYYSILAPFIKNEQHLNLFSIEMTLDVYYLKKVWRDKNKLPRGEDREMIKNSLGTEIDLLNILWVIRARKYYHAKKEMIYTFLLPIRYKLKREDLIDMVEADSIEEMYKVIQTTVYKDVFDDSEILLEKAPMEYTYELHLKKLRLNPFSISTVMTYLHRKEVEITNIIKIIEGIRYGLGKDSIMRYLITN